MMCMQLEHIKMNESYHRHKRLPLISRAHRKVLSIFVQIITLECRYVLIYQSKSFPHTWLCPSHVFLLNYLKLHRTMKKLWNLAKIFWKNMDLDWVRCDSFAAHKRYIRWKFRKTIGSIFFSNEFCLQKNQELERKLSVFHGREDAILYASCFDANAGLFEAILTPEDAIFSDELNHASIIDGIRLCKAQKQRYLHRNMDGLNDLFFSALHSISNFYLRIYENNLFHFRFGRKVEIIECTH